MKETNLLRNLSLALLVAGLVVTPALAKKPAWAGGGDQGQGNKHERSEKHESNNGPGNHDDHGRGGDSVRTHGFFVTRQRTVVHRYYDSEFHGGHCPPGLAKKHNGCMPPGQAKKWAVGRPLPRDVIYYDLPPRLIVDLGPPPRGHKYVRVASDILLLAVGTNMVVDAINDLGN